MRMSRWAIVTATLVAAVCVGTASEVVAEDPTGGRITPMSPTRRDTRDPGGGGPLKQLAIGPGVLAITAMPMTGSGSLTVRTCGTAPSASDPTLLYSAGSTATLSVVRDDNACAYASSAIHMTVDRYGSVSAAPSVGGSQYVPLPNPIELISGLDHFLSPHIDPVELGRPAAIPADATAAVVTVESGNSGIGGYATVARCGAPSHASTMNFPTSFPAAIAMPMIGPTDTLCLDGQTLGVEYFDLTLNLIGYLSPIGPDPMSVPPMYTMGTRPALEPGFAAINPDRALDTRHAIGVIVDGRHTRVADWKLAARETIAVDMSEYVGPWTTALSLNVTVTETEDAGFLTVWPCDEPFPEASNLNWAAGETRANLAVAMFSADGTVCVFTSSATHLVIDVTGVYDFAHGVPAVGIAPKRILDTREALGVRTKTPVRAGATAVLTVTGRGGVPASGVQAVTMNLTAVLPTAGGFVTAWPCDERRPTASNLNYVAGQIVPNLVTVGVSAQGTVCLYSHAQTHLVADVSAWYGAAGTSGLVERPPKRILDTRLGLGASKRKVAAAEVLAVKVHGRGGVAADAGSVVMNVTVTEPERDGFVTVWPCGQQRPIVSNLNFRAGDTVPNLVSVKLSTAGTVCVMSTARTHLVADVAGYLTTKKTTLPAIVLV